MKPCAFRSRSILGFFLVVLLSGIAACNGSGTNNSGTDTGSSSSPTSAQFTALQVQVNSLQSSVATLQAQNDELKATESADQSLIKRIALLGHVPGASAYSTKQKGQDRTLAITESVSFGPCPDMGVHIGDSQSDPLYATVESFKQCTGYEYGAIVETGAITKSIVLWFDGSNCTGNMYEAENDGGYNRQVLQNGVVFTSPVDGTTELMVAGGQVGSVVTLQSNFSGGSCNTGVTEIQTSYIVTPNNVDVTGVPAAVPANFIL